MKQQLQFILLLLLLICYGCSQSAPSREEAAAAIRKVMPAEFQVVSIRPLPEIAGLCEVVIKVGGKPVVLYLDKKAKYAVSGSILAVDSRKNLTLDVQRQFEQK